MWTYYGSKSKIVGLYPKPVYPHIIEPFSGTARYALKYFEKEVTLCDKYPVVIQIWEYLKQASRNDVLTLPNLDKGADLRTITSISESERLLLGMLAGVASIAPRNIISGFAAEQNGRKTRLKRIADNLHKIRHWNLICGDYYDLPDTKATWFIDPPYQSGGSAYVHNQIDYQFLRSWCESRQGQAIVCENTKADWMDFKPMSTMRGAMTTTTEAIWSNLRTTYDNLQIKLF